ncbi:restriction endonuclease subunit S [uncultured Micrococcus sp.]|uniref:restriction endonuclease subunit S n=1 Tax=uncultured Micrococcus sp. TaxID=114051 RepID=UPI0026399217|nr:restriction endonuclease subunit S [uncultured Micrococcus sp.]
MTTLQWSSELPAGWKVEKARRVLRRVKRPVRPEDRTVTAFRDGEVTLRSNRRTEGFTEAFAEFGYHGVRAGDLAVHAMDGFAGAIGVSDSDGKVSPVVHLYNVGLGDARFFAYALREAAQAGFVTSLAKGIRERSTSFDPQTLAAMDLPVPEPHTQRRIADYLDRETATIDALIDKQRAMRDLLAARRIRVMHALVTGQERERRASSEHWFGSLPSDWNSARLSHLSQIVLGKMINARTVSPGQTALPYLAAGSIQPDRLILDKCKVISVNEDEIEKYSLRSGDVLVVEGGAGYGRSHVLRAGLSGWVFQNHVARVRVDRGRLEPRYLRGALEVCRGSGFFEANNRTATLPSLSREVLGALVIPLPPLVEQREIADHLDRETAKIDALIAKAERFIELAQERRAALITAAVTGQIEIPTED